MFCLFVLFFKDGILKEILISLYTRDLIYFTSHYGQVQPPEKPVGGQFRQDIKDSEKIKSCPLYSRRIKAKWRKAQRYSSLLRIALTLLTHRIPTSFSRHFSLTLWKTLCQSTQCGGVGSLQCYTYYLALPLLSNSLISNPSFQVLL